MRPTPRCVLLFAAGVPLAVVPALLFPAGRLAWPVLLAATAAACVLDAARTLPARRMRVAARMPGRVVVGTPGPVALALSVERLVRPLEVEVLLDVDALLEAPAPVHARCEPSDVAGGGARAELELPVRPLRRGTGHVRRAHLRWTGPLGLFAVTRVETLDGEVPCIADLPAVRALALRFFGTRHGSTGLKTERYRGEGSEFESLQRWAPGFDPRAIDWRASARARRLLVRNFRAERDHQVVLAVDAGRLMSEPLGDVPRVDHAINAALQLAYVALRTGDRVGLYAFDAEPRAWIAPRSTMPSFTRLEQAAARIDYANVETNFTRAMLDLEHRLRKRSLVVVFTEFVDPVTAELMLTHVGRLARRHVVVFVALRDASLEDVTRREPLGMLDVNRAVVAGDLLAERHTVLQRLRRAGVAVLDALPGEAGAELLNRYLDIKRRERV
ncbi:MAG: DUF58 domain-containing protein [Planctomycetes bacterium]|nr:DUF58 domain-containing protein [Planctomycetota bacterium]